MSDNVTAILRASGLNPDHAKVRPITGGVSSETYAVSLPDGDVIVKQALAMLKVKEQWSADPGRIVAEGQGLEWFHSLTPDYVPRPLAVIEDLHGLVLPMAPQPCPDLRTVIIESPELFRPEWVDTLAHLLNIWHTADPGGARGTRLDDTTRLVELRIEPFYRNMASRWPEYEKAIVGLAEELLTARTAVVHGDFTPKNILCLPDGGLWVIDTEVCHIGNPVLDSASMLTHLVLKSFLYKSHERVKPLLAQARRQFLGALSPASAPKSLGAHVGLFLGVRVAGRAPVSYLSSESMKNVELMSRALLRGASLAEEEEKWLM